MSERPKCLRPMTQKEMDEFVPLTAEEIDEALRKGAEEAEAQRNMGVPIMPYSIWNPRPGPMYR